MEITGMTDSNALLSSRMQGFYLLVVKEHYVSFLGGVPSTGDTRKTWLPPG